MRVFSKAFPIAEGELTTGVACAGKLPFSNLSPFPFFSFLSLCEVLPPLLLLLLLDDEECFEDCFMSLM